VRENVATSTPLRREGRADEVADLVVSLASDESSFLACTSVDMNGGSFFS
jgi:3-oxoacyl-[acyl-carrier protein] reductase